MTYLNDLYLQRLYLYLGRAQAALLLSGTLALGLCYQRPEIGALGLGATLGNTFVLQASRRLRGYLEDEEALIEDAWQYRKLKTYREEPTKAIQATKAQGIHIDPGKCPHVMLLGTTGSGKSTLAAGLMDGLEGLKIAIAPHYQNGDYPGCHYVLGIERNYGTGQESSPRITDLLKAGRAVSCTEALGALVAEMDYRFGLVNGRYRYEVEGLPRLEVILDEYPAWGTIEGTKGRLTRLLLEARKVGIRLWILAQGGEVKMLGMEGNGSLREQTTLIRGRGFLKGIGLGGVTEELPGSIDCSGLPKAVQEYLKAQEYPWLLGDQPLDTTGLTSRPVTQVVLGLTKAPVDYGSRYQALRSACKDLGWSDEEIERLEEGV